MSRLNIQTFPIKDRWVLHSYYSLCPYAPDGSGRILAAGTDLSGNTAEVLVLSPTGDVLQRFGHSPVTNSFWHTGLWQSWSPDASEVYFQSGTHLEPKTIRYHLETGQQIEVEGDIEGLPPSGEPAFSCNHGMLYAAGYGDGKYKPEQSSVPFAARDKHGVSKIYTNPPCQKLALSTEEILEKHPNRDRIHKADKEIRDRLGPGEGLTLMTYCVRWNRAGSRCLFFFGNHCVDKNRQEPKITSVFTADRDLKDIYLAVDISFEKRGVHWAWQADDEKLIGYGPVADNPGKISLAEVNYDGSDYRWLSDHASGGHPSTSPADPDLIVTDEGTPSGGAVLFISRKTGQTIERVELPKFVGESEPPGRNALRICHHPVFNHTGDKVLCNTMQGKYATLAEITPPGY